MTNKKTINQEELARALHYAGKSAVAKNLVVNKVEFPKFLSWEEIDESAREGRRLQAAALIEQYNILPKEEKSKKQE